MASPKIMRLKSSLDFRRFVSGLYSESPYLDHIDPREYDFLLAENDLYERKGSDWIYRGSFADEWYATKYALELWPHWGTSVTAPGQPSPGKWQCIRCGSWSDDIPASFHGNYDYPVCERCV